MARATDETIHIEFDINSCVTYQGEQLSEHQINQIKKTIEHQLKDIVYDTVLENCDDEGDSGLTDFVIDFTEFKHINNN